LPSDAPSCAPDLHPAVHNLVIRVLLRDWPGGWGWVPAVRWDLGSVRL
jgi:hypothetical protein